MFPVTIEQIARIIEGRLIACKSGHISPVGGSIDSRSIRPGEIFFALNGMNVCGADFISAAYAAGASCGVVADSDSGRLSTELPLIAVSDVAEALTKLAYWNRQQSRATVVAVTGSVGKTTTRRMIHAVLTQAGPCVQSPANFNNHLGVPLSLLQIAPIHKFAVLELGASAKGEIANLARIALPQTAVITRVAPVHLTGFESLQGVQQAKGELVRAVSTTGYVVLNGDDELVRSMQSWTRGRVVLAGETMGCDIRATDIRTENGHLAFCVDGFPFDLAASGRHLLFCALAAIAVGSRQGLDHRQIADGLKSFQPEAGRGRVYRSGELTVIDDAYNASPVSVQAAIQTLSEWRTSGKRILVLGDMLELGDDADQYHGEIGQLLAASNIDVTLFIGEFGPCISEGFSSVASNIGNRIEYFGADLGALVDQLRSEIQPNAVVLIKGSRGLRMERVLDALRQSFSSLEE